MVGRRGSHEEKANKPLMQVKVKCVTNKSPNQNNGTHRKSRIQSTEDSCKAKNQKERQEHRVSIQRLASRDSITRQPLSVLTAITVVRLMQVQANDKSRNGESERTHQENNESEYDDVTKSFVTAT